MELMFNLCIRFNTFRLGDPEKALFSALVLISPGKGIRLLQYERHTIKRPRDEHN